ncbi:hypothetical protein HBI56_101970 [Parastagonospora nodorum]|nr:hypothetical protein HBH56_030930 [Parastagonospora nodorum]KAH3934377.1 hypothetical protein HBH54_051080 [Parastagonospora nodorum]KAH3956630.1 hypothetical protein HBH51_238430 [Parastagonospora nodorum]KAH3985294.1 hypothetical protein HBH52_049810 [Parastagonospora nodorum]KAH4005804.1 hypothetical protein HBI10_022110 [Parastagonospora nodorum]
MTTLDMSCTLHPNSRFILSLPPHEHMLQHAHIAKPCRIRVNTPEIRVRSGRLPYHQVCKHSMFKPMSSLACRLLIVRPA